MLFALSLPSSSSLFEKTNERVLRGCWVLLLQKQLFSGERKKGRKEGRKEDDKVSKKRHKNVAFRDKNVPFFFKNSIKP